MAKAIQVHGRRLTEGTAMSPLVGAVTLLGALAWFVVTITRLALPARWGDWLGWPQLVAGGACAGALGGHFWARLTTAGRALVCAPIGLAAASFTMTGLGVRGAEIVGYAAWAFFVFFVAIAVEGRFGFVQWYGLSSQFLRRHKTTEPLRLVLEPDVIRVLTKSDEEDGRWPVAELESAELEPKSRALCLRDRIGDELLVEIQRDDLESLRKYLKRVRRAV